MTSPNTNRADRKNTTLHLPLKVSLTEEAIHWFIKHNKKLMRVQLGDSSSEYGLVLSSISLPALQKMISLNYVSLLEIGRMEFSSKRSEILDLTKLIAYQILYKDFERQAVNLFLETSLIRHWNRTHPTRIIDNNSAINRKFVECFLEDSKAEITEIREEITAPVLQELGRNPRLSEEERQIYEFQAERFLQCIPSTMWCILTKSRGLREYELLIEQIQKILTAFLEKSTIPEYLSLMILELLNYTEKSLYTQTIKDLYPHYNEQAGQAIIMDPGKRQEALETLRKQGEQIYLAYQIGAKKASIGTAGRLQITILNSEQEYRETKKRIEEKMDLETNGKSLLNFYKEEGPAAIAQELGLFYLSYLHDACAKMNIRFESTVTQTIQETGQTIIRLALHF